MDDVTTTAADARTRLANRSALLSLLSTLFFFIGILTFGSAAQREEPAISVVSGTPLAAAAGTALWARATRSRLRALGGRSEGADAAPADPAVRQELPAGPPGAPPTSRSS